MAGLEDNPFRDPSDINPFTVSSKSGLDCATLRDPAVTQVTDPAPSASDDDYNPFADQQSGSPSSSPKAPLLPRPLTAAKAKGSKKEKSKRKKPSAQWPSKEPTPAAVTEPEQDSPPSYSPKPYGQSNQFSDREEEIARREASLHDRERNLEQLGPPLRNNNFPPFPSWCPGPLKPCCYINIRVEVPAPERWKVYSLLALLIYLWVLLLANFLVSLYGAIVTNNNRSVYLTTMGVSILYIILFAPGSLLCWFLPAYYAYRKDSSLAFFLFFIFMSGHILVSILSAIGIPHLGGCGFVNGAGFFCDDCAGAEHAAGAMYIIIGLMWFISGPFALFLLIMTFRYFRSSRGSLNRAAQEAMTGAAGNRHVRGAVRSGVKTGVSAAMSQ